MIDISVAKNQADVNEAFLLANEVFSENCPNHSDELKMAAWQERPGFSPEDIVLLKDSKKLIGLVRIAPTVFITKGKRIESAGISSVCVANGCRDKGFSSKLMNASLEIIKDRGYELSHLIARRAVDYFYLKYGFIGASSYHKIFVKQSNDSSEQDDFERVPGFDPQRIGQYVEAYTSSYKNCFGQTDRTREYWAYIGKRLELTDEFSFYNIFYHSTWIGYYICEGDIIDEVGISSDFTGDLPLHVFNDNKSQNNAIFSIPFNHTLVGLFYNLDVTFSSRRCLYGGHMIKIMKHNVQQIDQENLYKYLPRFEKELNIKIGKFSDSADAFNLNFFDQC